MKNRQPLLLITRPEAEAQQLVREIRQACPAPVDILLSPLIEIEPIACDVSLEGFSGVIFTSKNGVRCAPKPKTDNSVLAFCVGARTAEAAQSKGYLTLSANGNATDLIKMILCEDVQGPLIHFRGAHSRGEIAKNLAKAGRNIISQVVYRQNEAGLTKEAMTALAESRPVVVPLYSPRTAQMLVNQGPHPSNVTFVTISQAVADVIAVYDTNGVIVAEHPDGVAMIEAICFALGGNSSVSGP